MRPQFPGDEQAVAFRVVGDAVQHVDAVALGCRQQPLQVEPSGDATRGRVQGDARGRELAYKMVAERDNEKYSFARESRLHEAGVTFAPNAPAPSNPWEQYWTGTAQPVFAPNPARPSKRAEIVIQVPIEITVRIGKPSTGVPG